MQIAAVVFSLLCSMVVALGTASALLGVLFRLLARIR
jgi:hypothetical protein